MARACLAVSDDILSTFVSAQESDSIRALQASVLATVLAPSRLPSGLRQARG